MGNYEAFCLCELAMLFIEPGSFQQGVRLVGLTLALTPKLYTRPAPTNGSTGRRGSTARGRPWGCGLCPGLGGRPQADDRRRA